MFQWFFFWFSYQDPNSCTSSLQLTYTHAHTHIEVISQELLSFHSIEQLREQPLTRARSDSARSEFGAALVIPVRVRNRGTATPKERVELGESSQGRP